MELFSKKLLNFRDGLEVHVTPFTEDEAKSYSKKTCKKCNSKGYVEYSFPRQYTEIQLCPCVFKNFHIT